MSSVEIRQMSAVETGQMSAAETGQMSAAETRQMLKSQIGGWAKITKMARSGSKMVARPRESTQMDRTAVPKPLGPVPRPKIQQKVHVLRWWAELFGTPSLVNCALTTRTLDGLVWSRKDHHRSEGLAHTQLLLGAVLAGNVVPRSQGRSDRAERSERDEQCSEHFWACCGHCTLDIVRWTLYVGHRTLDIVCWTLYVGHRIDLGYISC